ncbi:hypothetical protein QQS21_007373 [Conoideocrella luteorostrata]|uniref:Uncharacterized protein n=1 Tax=Conoideocrella luteorostrata TaxID=1105319 RepID=A0AAJ0CL86_9HYPO|nr:hypothetical protein QQS21_007373 [Conoideocrella luteorostrata]
MRFFTNLTLLLSSLMLCHGYYLDVSCDKKQQAVVEKWVKNAVDLASAALTTLRFLEDAAGVDEKLLGPVCTASNELMKTLFRRVLTNNRVDASNERYKEIKSRFEKIIHHDPQRNGVPEVTPPNLNVPNNPSHDLPPVERQADRFKHLFSEDLVIYCDYSRFEEGRTCGAIENPTSACDTSTGVTVDIDSWYTECKNSLTSDSKWSSWVQPLAPGPRQIQLCPGYLSRASDRHYQVLEDIRHALTVTAFEPPHDHPLLPEFEPYEADGEVVQGDVTPPVQYAYLGDAIMLEAMLKALRPEGMDPIRTEQEPVGWIKARAAGRRLDGGTSRSASHNVYYAIGSKLSIAPAGGQLLTIMKTSGRFTYLYPPEPGDLTV